MGKNIELKFQDGVLHVLSESDNLSYNQFRSALKENLISIYKINEIVLPDNIVELDEGLFSDFIALKKINIPSKIKSIPGTCFSHCSSLKEIKIPKGVKKITSKAFVECESLEKIELPNSLKTIEDGAFAMCKSLEKIEIPDSVENIECYAFCKCSRLKNIKLPNQLKTIHERLFSACTSLKSIVIPPNVESIEREAFELCTSLNEIALPNKLEKIKEGGFARCFSLESITIPSTVKNIEDSAFIDCHNLNNIDLPRNLEKLGQKVFENCKSLQKVIVPPNVKEIKRNAFSSCCNLKEVILQEGLEIVGDSAFEGTSLESVILPEGVKEISSNAFAECDKLQKVHLPESLSVIKADAFKNCTKLETINIPNNVTSIENSAFFNCKSLTEIDIPYGVKKIGARVFCFCRSLETIKIPKGLEDVAPGFIETDRKVKRIIYNNDIEIDMKDKLLVGVKNYGIGIKDYDNTFGFFDGNKYICFNINDIFKKANNINKIDLLKDKDEWLIPMYLWSGKNKFMPHYTIVKNMPINDIDMFYINNNCNKWAEILRHTPIQYDSNKATLFKLCYVLGVFQESGIKRDQAVEFIKEHILNKLSEDKIHAKFDGFETRNGSFDPMYAEFFMKYYKDNPDFMMVDRRTDLLAASYNNFKLVRQLYPNKVVNTNREADVLRPEHVINAINCVEYYNVDDDNENLALKLGVYGYSQRQFEELQKLFNQGKKIKDSNLMLFINKDKEDNNSITYELLEKDNPLGVVLGNITNCCQILGGTGGSCVEYGITQPNSKFMTFNLNKQIIGQAWVWYDNKTGVVCLDNIEVPHKYLDKINHNKEMQESFVQCLKRMADNFINEMKMHGLEVKQVTIGEGYNDIKNILNNNFFKDKNIKKLSGYDGYSDAIDGQYIIKKK